MRSLVAILTLVYFAVSSGVVMNVHYCMGKKQSVKLNVMGSASCRCGKKAEKKKGCCKTESRFVKLADVQKASYANYAIQAPVAETDGIQRVPWSLPVYGAMTNPQPAGHSPPLLSGQDTYLRNCVFRI